MFRRLGNSFRRMMDGRYGSDQLNMALLVTAIVLALLNSILSAFIGGAAMSIVSLVLTILTYSLLGYELFRCFSRNIYKRRQENRRFMTLWNRLRDRSHRYFRCPQCRQLVRVPKNRGKLNIRCPKCGERFIRKT